MNHEPVRESERVEVLGELHGEVMVYQRMVISQISAGGALIETAFALHVDSLHEFRLTLGDQSVVTKGRVVHSHIADVERDIVMYQSGIEFVELSEPAAAVIIDFIGQLKHAAEGLRPES